MFDESKQAVSPLHFAGKHIAAVVYSSFPADPRPRRAAEILARAGASVEVICLKETDEEPLRESFNGVEITRIPLKRRRGGKLSYLFQYGWFVLLSGAILTSRMLRKRYDLVHVHNMPDFLVFSALVPKLLGTKVILDLHDPMPELMMTIFGLREASLAVKALKRLEKWSLGFADRVLTVNEACRKIFSTRSCPAEKISVIMNSPEELIFQFRAPWVHGRAVGVPKPFVIMYHGSLVERHGLDLAVTALEKAKGSLGDVELRIYGRSTPFLEQVMEAVRKKPELSAVIRYLGPKKLEEIVEAIRECDVGIIPNRRSIFTELNTPTRIFEYLSQGKPVIAPRAQGILDYFGPRELVYFELGNADDLAAKMEYVFGHPEEMFTMVKSGQRLYLTHKWSSEGLQFVSIVDGLLKVAGHSAVQPEGQTISVLGSQE
jgi:glycosyltransferase involved in cell wall biosynthesis